MLICAILLIFLGYRMVQSIQQDWDTIFLYLYIFAIGAVIIGATKVPSSRQYILSYPRKIRIAGVVIGGTGVALLVYLIVAAAQNEQWAGSELAVWAVLAPIFLGFMVYRLPAIATPNKEIVEFLQWIHKWIHK